MEIKTTENLLGFVRMMLSLLNLGDSIPEPVDHPEGLELPAICIDKSFTLWLGDGNQWFADAAHTSYSSSSGYDTSISELYVGPSHMDAFAEIFKAICNDRFERARGAWMMEQEAKEGNQN